MSESQHPQPKDTETNPGQPASAAARAVVQPVVPSGLDSLTAVGARLAQLRESKGWSIDDVSARLKVPSTRLQALEAGDISHLPDATFALGVVRSYAKMLGADPAPFTQALRREKGIVQPDLSLPASSGRDLPRGRVSLSLGGNAQKRHRSWLWGVAAIIVAVLALAMWHTNSGDSSAWLARLKASASGSADNAAGASGTLAQASGASEEPASVPDAQAATGNAASAVPLPVPLPTAAVPASAAPALTAAASVPKAGSVPATSATSAITATKPATTAATTAAMTAASAAAGESIVALRVKQDSWLSVRQKDGKELFSGLVHAGDTKEITGAAPFKVTIGNQAGLESITLDGRPVDPSKYASAKGNVARFALP